VQDDAGAETVWRLRPQIMCVSPAISSVGLVPEFDLDGDGLDEAKALTALESGSVR
jgi:hypothetical protein